MVSLAAAALIAFLIVQRIAELVLSRRNTAVLMRRGAVEFGAGHYPLIVALHVSWLAALVAFGIGQPVSIAWLGVFVILQALRVWTIWTLGVRWTTRIFVVDEPTVTAGPFRWVKHPNYLIVIAEIFTVPMMLGLPTVAAVFSMLNAAVLVIRIGAEEAALADSRGD